MTLTGLCRLSNNSLSKYITHTGYAAIENVNIIDERRSKIVRNRVYDRHLSPERGQKTIENIVSSVFYPRSSIVKSDFDCRLSGKLPKIGVLTHYLLWRLLITFGNSLDPNYLTLGWYS